MPFINEEIDEEIMKAFAESVGISYEDPSIEISISDTTTEKSISMKADSNIGEDIRTTRLSIRQVDRQNYHFQGGTTTAIGRKMDTTIDQPMAISSPEKLPLMVRKVLANARVKGQGQQDSGLFRRMMSHTPLKGYFGGENK